MRLAAAILLCVAACGRAHWDGGDPALYGVLLEVEPGAPFTDSSDFRLRLKHILDATSRYFGHDPSELDGLRIVVRNHWQSCADRPAQVAGCYSTDDNTAVVSTAGFQCIEGTAVAHELLHYFIGDFQHTDPRWHAFGPLWSEMVPDGCRPFSTD